jgi:SAM-dependent methyltransferase
MHNNKVVEILEKYKINGFSYKGGTDKATDHSYDAFYSEKLNEYFDKEVLILEIGVQFGGSSLLWHELMPKSKLVLVDMKDQMDENIASLMSKDRYDYYIMDAYYKDSVLELKAKYADGFDIIIEDGPHSLQSQIFTVQNYLDLLKNDGILILEDIQSFDYCKQIIESIDKNSFKSYEIVDLRQIKNRYDDLLIYIKK